MYSALDFFGPRVYVVSDEMYREYKAQKVAEKRKEIEKDLEYYRGTVSKLEKQLAELTE
jgi:isocitrate lyase